MALRLRQLKEALDYIRGLPDNLFAPAL